MNLGPLEYVVIGVMDANDHQPLTRALLSELEAIQAKDHIRVVNREKVRLLSRS